MVQKEKIIQSLRQENWEPYMGVENYHYWKTSDSNRYVDIEGVYIDIYVYKDEEKWGTWLNIKEMELFTNLAIILLQEAEEHE